MKINYIDEDTLDIYIIKNRLDIDYSNESDVKELLKILNDKYNVNIEGFYDVVVYIDKYYGVVIHMERAKDYFNYYKDMDIRLSIKECNFLYQVDDYIKNKKIHIIDNNMYLEITDQCDLMYILENSNSILYNYSK